MATKDDIRWALAGDPGHARVVALALEAELAAHAVTRAELEGERASLAFAEEMIATLEGRLTELAMAHSHCATPPEAVAEILDDAAETRVSEK